MSAAPQSPEQLPLFLCIGDLDVDVMIEVDRLPTRDGKVNGIVKQKAPGGMAETSRRRLRALARGSACSAVSAMTRTEHSPSKASRRQA